MPAACTLTVPDVAVDVGGQERRRRQKRQPHEGGDPEHDPHRGRGRRASQDQPDRDAIDDHAQHQQGDEDGGSGRRRGTGRGPLVIGQRRGHHPHQGKPERRQSRDRAPHAGTSQHRSQQGAADIATVRHLPGWRGDARSPPCRERRAARPRRRCRTRAPVRRDRGRRPALARGSPRRPLRCSRRYRRTAERPASSGRAGSSPHRHRHRGRRDRQEPEGVAPPPRADAAAASERRS